MQPAQETLFGKIWRQHQVAVRADGQVLLYVDRHYLHDGSMRPFEILAERGLDLRRPDLSFGLSDHHVPTAPGRSLAGMPAGTPRDMVTDIEAMWARKGVPAFRLGDPRQGIVHVAGPEQGLTLPGQVVVCGDSHTATHGALGALAFGIGASEVAHVMAYQSLWQKRPATLRITVSGRLGPGVSAKDLILAIIARIGANGAAGHVIEYAGAAVRALPVEQRLTLCNMSIEAGGRAGLVAPDDTIFEWLAGRPHAPQGAAWEAAIAGWRLLPGDAGAVFDREVALDGDAVRPMATWGTSPEHALPLDGLVPDPADASDPAQRAAWNSALAYMDLTPGTPVSAIPIDRVFIGSCTNSRMEDLRAAAAILRGRKAVIPAWVVPGSGEVRRQAEAEGLDQVFRAAGVEFREPGCSMCVAMNGDVVAPGQRCASTSNRNFQGRQGKGARTHLVSPATAAAAAVTGRLADPRPLMGG
jgi:3-isopropylmalate/(R)-2-methylmalate dehydratase large subunit